MLSLTGEAITTATPWFTVTEQAAYADAVEDFLTTGSPSGVPVWTGERTDLAESVQRSASLYDGVARPAPYRHGVLLSADALPDGLIALLRPLAARWHEEHELTGEFAGRAGSLLVVGLYRHLTLDPVRDIVLSAHRSGRTDVAFLTGRDAPSLAWFTAKQYAVPASGVTATGLFSASDRPAPQGPVDVFDERRLEREDIRATVLETQWKRVLFQGHGKDDSLNLADFTLCGRSDAAPRVPGLLGPACAYADICYKPKDKLIPLHRVRAVEMVLGSCNSAPLADAALYDPKYQLMLDAVDGTAQDIVAALTVHDSGRPENAAWMDGILADASSTDLLNSSIRTIQPYPAFLRFGLDDRRHRETPPPPPQTPDPLLLTVSARLTAYLAGSLLPQSNPLHTRLSKMARKAEQWVVRQAPAAHGSEKIMQALTADLQSLDHAIAQQLSRDPNNELADYPAYFGDRSVLDESTVETVRCQCGRPAQRFLKRALVPTALDTECVVCVRCGDVAFRVPESPRVWIEAADEVATGGTLDVRVRVRGTRRGPVRVGVFVPRYLQCTIAPAHRRIRTSPDREQDGEFSLTLSPDTPAQAYYLTAYAVQDLGLSTTRRHFGVVPARG
ncbi:hypothetical protein KBZ10_17730 [Streptomyces sp. F63]|uniref:hypothetical protein n=1 Tax=Streptomyces sp. F63 TaxID=2824887 RepID=UPI001B376679|nr:hypothetical protein [Streptomyces sp. F63]MBQ0986319.1 hypothetical protein [Streptomyces sp. F63]